MRMSHLWKRPWLLPALALTLALAAVGCSSAKTDAQLAGEVQNKINGDLPAQRIVVSVAGGTVTLSGTVNRDDERLKASSDAAEIEGVKTVINNLQVAPAAASIPEAPPPAPPQSRPAVTRSSPSHSKVRPTEMASNDSPSSPAPAVIPPFTPPPPPDPIPAAPEHVTIPAGTTVSVRMVDGLDSEVNQVGDTFRASLESPIMVEDRVVAPAGTEVQGRVTDVKSAGHFKGRSELTMQLVRLQMNGKSYTLATSVWNAKGSSRGTRTAATIGGGSALGAIIGAIAGGGKGAAIGAAAGAGAGTGVQGITKGKPIKVQPEDVLQFRLANDVTVVPSASGAATRDPDRPRLERR
ncbi:MAG TPA: BON domain-containing protein [Terriglobales bacterium]|nr:BON domain-containing protein [Terriglobales bacterium]